MGAGEPRDPFDEYYKEVIDHLHTDLTESNGWKRVYEIALVNALTTIKRFNDPITEGISFEDLKKLYIDNAIEEFRNK